MHASVLPPRVKVCCIASLEEARMAIDAGASAIGLVSEMPSGPGPIPERLIERIAATIPPPVATFLLTCRTDVAGIVEQQRRCRTNTIQLVDRVAPDVHAALRDELPGIGIVQVVHVTGPESVREAEALGRSVDAILLDTGDPSAAVRVLGGTGRVHDWAISARIVQTVRVPVFLAGGLHAGNVAEAIRQVRPFGVDLCSGVRTEGRLDRNLLRAFFGSIAEAGSTA
jgi:phosphoribosylanthranilate isomerase